MTYNYPQKLDYLTTLGLPIDQISQPELLHIALTHKSFAADFTHDHPHNERLEFLGDSVVWLIINHLLYLNFPAEAESTLTLHKISLVRQDTLALVARNIWLDQQILIGNGEQRKGWRNNDAILCDCFEALVGWVYLDLGWEVAYQFVQTYVYHLVESVDVWPIKSYKSLIQEYAQSIHKSLPEYNDRELTRDNRRNEVTYESTITINDVNIAVWLGTSKRKAQEEAAKSAYEVLHS